MCGIVQNRANLAATLKDARTVVGKLERFMAVVVQALFLFLYLMIWQVRSWIMTVLGAGAAPASVPHDRAGQFCGPSPGCSCFQVLQQAQGVLDSALDSGQVHGQLLYLQALGT